MRRTRTTTTRVTVSSDRGVFMISVAAELAEMHPQTLRMYEQRGLIEPKRSPKGTRLYSQDDVERLRRIQAMTNELGLNLAGVEHVLELEQELERSRRRARRARAPHRGAAGRDAGPGRGGPPPVPGRARAAQAHARHPAARTRPPDPDGHGGSPSSARSAAPDPSGRFARPMRPLNLGETLDASVQIVRRRWRTLAR